MVVPPLLRSLLLLLAAGPVAGCASGLQVTAGRPTRLMLIQRDNQLTLTLVNLSAADQVRTVPTRDGALYEANTTDAGRKFMNDDELQGVLGVFEQAGLLASSSPTPAPDALGVVVLECNGVTYCWSRRLRGMQASERPFHEARALFQAAYNSVTAWHGRGDQVPDLKAEQRRAAEAARDPVRRSPENPR